MQTLEELFGQDFTPEVFTRREPRVTVLTTPMSPAAGAPRHSAYEAEVFNFLLKKKKDLGIKSVLAFENLLVDGATVLAGDRRLAIEIKLRMNWMKACQAESEFRNFLKTAEARRNPVSGAL